jgi:hypothetical protein
MNYEQFKEINKKVSGFLSNERYAAEKYPEFSNLFLNMGIL